MVTTSNRPSPEKSFALKKKGKHTHTPNRLRETLACTMASNGSTALEIPKNLASSKTPEQEKRKKDSEGVK